METDPRERAKLWPKGRLYDDFQVGQTFHHHWGRTILASDAALFSSLTLAYNPLYFNRAYAIAHGHPDIVVNPQLAFNVVLGLSVEDCSEIGGPFLGIFDLNYYKQIYANTTITARSETVEMRLSESDPRNGIVTWRTEGFDEAGDCILAFRRSNLVRRRNEKGPG
ncbi:MaoC family dehydratase [Brevundimonas sp.]|uniref:MaoC family dehydratase n=1 Tax=Brevundimonas sp. TaxID=1871086 RepID=UPI0028A1E1FC|nr:MaoC family dehydratase [Brevundimonas sp.]